MRRMNGIGIVLVILVFALIEYYSYTAIRFAVRSVKPPYKTYITIAYILITVIWFGVLLSFPVLRTAEMSKTMRNVLISFTMGLMITKILIAVILLIDDVRRGVFLLAGLFYGKESMPAMVQSGMTRSDFLARFALLFGGTIFSSMLYGMSNRYNYKIKKVDLSFDNLPEAFKGLKIIQISDIHSGSLNDAKAINKGIDMILAQKPDIIFFTGDLVNNKSDEIQEFMPVFSRLKAPMGVYSILGNHDYGDYVEWPSAEAKANNLQVLKDAHAKLGWRLLLDEHVVMERDGQTMAVIGVENTSFKNRFQTYGSLSKAYAGSEKHPFKILLSHDPSHWDGEVNTLYKDVDLTLSGHTHGFQFGVDIPGLQWSPIQYLYKQWAGLYSQGKQYLYVNRGFGFLGYPGRVGIMPEITVIHLT